MTLARPLEEPTEIEVKLNFISTSTADRCHSKWHFFFLGLKTSWQLKYASGMK
jgi:hypothetical protein